MNVQSDTKVGEENVNFKDVNLVMNHQTNILYNVRSNKSIYNHKTNNNITCSLLLSNQINF